MFRITGDPSSGSLVQCLAKNYRNYSTVSIDMDKVSVMAAYSDLLCVCVVRCTRRHHTFTVISARQNIAYETACTNVILMRIQVVRNTVQVEEAKN